MYKDKRILAVVPARGGSKGIPLKNITMLAGKPLLAYTAEVISLLPMLDRAVVSTDHQAIVDVAIQYGLAAPFRRPEDLSADIVADWDVLVHALLTMEQLDTCCYDVIVMLQPTCPLRQPQHVIWVLESLLGGEYDAVWTVSSTDGKSHPLKQLIIKDGLLDYYDPDGRMVVARQQLQPVYHRNGAAYAITRECLMNKRNIKGDRCGAVVVDEPLANIDTMIDINFAEFLINQFS
jgi:CMP-N,N'-diacetyllegionaminic acid synthase